MSLAVLSEPSQYTFIQGVDPSIIVRKTAMACFAHKKWVEKGFSCPEEVGVFCYESLLSRIKEKTKLPKPGSIGVGSPVLYVAYQTHPPTLSILGFCCYKPGLVRGQLFPTYKESMEGENTVTHIPQLTEKKDTKAEINEDWCAATKNGEEEPIFRDFYVYKGWAKFPRKMDKDVVSRSLVTFWFWMRSYAVPDPKNVEMPRVTMDRDLIFSILLLSCYENPEVLMKAYSGYLRAHITQNLKDLVYERGGIEVSGVSAIEDHLLGVVRAAAVKLQDTKEEWLPRMSRRMASILEMAGGWFKPKVSVRNKLF